MCSCDVCGREEEANFRLRKCEILYSPTKYYKFLQESVYVCVYLYATQQQTRIITKQKNKHIVTVYYYDCSTLRLSLSHFSFYFLVVVLYYLS